MKNEKYKIETNLFIDVNGYSISCPPNHVNKINELMNIQNII